ncbi:MAG: FkbM family methyltransferase [Bacteroidetes bacterium]|nr:FkbM family methyltransferase [Bacteroidota bacterium]MBS1736024.1 FkbM family methyltransferase [Bacteroidota bacterium]MBS1744598.1 FkbM family methyltransferase [Bacteroidota bacterium]
MKEKFIEFPQGAHIRRSTVLKRDFITLFFPGQEIVSSISGTKVEIEFIRHPWSGAVEITLGERIEKLDLYGAEQFVYRYSTEIPPGVSTLRIKALGPDLSDNNISSQRGTEVWIGRIISNNKFSDQSDIRIFPVDDIHSLVDARIGRFLVNNNDMSVSGDIMHSGYFAERDSELFKKLLKPGMYVYDIGANIGHHSVLFSLLVGPSGKVYSFEPQNYIFKVLNANLALNNCSNAWSYRWAIGKEKAKLKMYPIDYSQKNNFGGLGIDLSKQITTASAGERIDVITGDEFLDMLEEEDKKIDFIKIDVQSFELFVLQGLTGVLSRFKPMLFLEIAPFWMKEMGYDYSEIYDLLYALGYKIYMPHESLEFPVKGITAWNGEKMVEWDILAIAD